MIHAFRESLDPAAARVKSLEARLGQESQRCLQLEKHVQSLRESCEESAARINGLEALLAKQAERMLEMEKQMQAFLGSTKHPIAQVRDLEPRIVEPESPQTEVLSKVSTKVVRQVRRKV